MGDEESDETIENGQLKMKRVHKVHGSLWGALSTAACAAESRNRESLNLKFKIKNLKFHGFSYRYGS